MVTLSESSQSTLDEFLLLSTELPALTERELSISSSAKRKIIADRNALSNEAFEATLGLTELVSRSRESRVVSWKRCSCLDIN